MPPKRKRGLMPDYKPDDEAEQLDEFNERLNILQGVNAMPAEESSKRRRGSRKSKSNTNYNQTGMQRESNVKSNEEFHEGRNESEIDHYPPKRPRVEASITLNIPNPWNVLPGLQPYPNSTLPANVIPKQKVPVATSQRSPEDASSFAMIPVSCNCVVDDAAESISGCSDLTMIDVNVMNNSPLDNMPTQVPSDKPNVSKVYSFKDLIVTNEMKIQTEDIVEPMRCDEVNAKRKTRNVSLVERFTDEEIMLHIMSLTKGSNEIEMSDSNEDLCQLCGGGKVMFPPPPVYCSHCNIRIKDSYRAIGEELRDAQYQLCSYCHNHCTRKFTVYGMDIIKEEMLKVNILDNKIAEEWVQCGSCEGWQHQICGLYNKDKDIDNTADYICPKCLLKERQSNNNSGFDDNTDLGAKDLPETILSYFIEQRLFKRLKEERSQTAETYGKSVDEVLEPEDLTPRVVYSADKTSIVNKKIYDYFQKEKYPSEFPNRSKAILLFQKVEGVDVCIFAMFVQEFGSECILPNQRTTYIVYLDSVKYFRPERVTFSGEALRTFVYHEILIGYLEYCKLRGFTTSYIWSCPPKGGQDYIMYSHPETQKIPTTKQLRQWYMSMLNKAVKEKAVVNVTNLHERFFVVKDKYNYMPAARLPYFEGSFWCLKAEEAIKQIENEGSNELPKIVKRLSRRKLKGLSYDSNGCVDIDDAKNILLMEKVETKLLPHKDDHMVVVLNYSCTRCSKVILSGLRWFCEKYKHLPLCESCYDEEQELPGEHILTWRDKEKHQLSKVEVKGISSTTEDNDIILENDMFESRLEFLGFSEKNNYHFDILRRAKHSSMMILHHLHTSNKHHRCSQKSSRFSCGVCNKDVSTTIYFPCLICSIFRLCTGCFSKNTTHRHLHLFPSLPSTKGAQPRTVMCQTTVTKSSCSYPKCNEVKLLFYHSAQCGKKEKVAFCKICNRLGKIIRIHANHCDDLECPVSRCKEMKDYFFKKILEDKGVKG